MVTFWVPDQGTDLNWEGKNSGCTTIENTYEIIEARCNANKKTNDFDKIEMMRVNRWQAVKAHQLELRINNKARTDIPEGWKEKQADWNFYAKYKFTYPDHDGPNQKSGLYQKANNLYKDLSNKEINDLKTNWAKQFPNHNGDIHQQPETSLEYAYYILVDGHVDNNGKHRTRDETNHYISTHLSNSIKRDLCMEFYRKCPTCSGKVQGRTAAHSKRTTNEIARKRQLEEEDHEASPNPEPKKRKTQVLKIQSMARPAQRAQSQPQQMGQYTSPVDQHAVNDYGYHYGQFNAPDNKDYPLHPFGQNNAPDNYNYNAMPGQMANVGFGNNYNNNTFGNQPEREQLQDAHAAPMPAMDQELLPALSMDQGHEFNNNFDFGYQPGQVENNAYIASHPIYDNLIDPMLNQVSPETQSDFQELLRVQHAPQIQQQEEVGEAAPEEDFPRFDLDTRTVWDDLNEGPADNFDIDFDQNVPAAMDEPNDEPAPNTIFGLDFDFSAPIAEEESRDEPAANNDSDLDKLFDYYTYLKDNQ